MRSLVVVSLVLTVVACASPTVTASPTITASPAISVTPAPSATLPTESTVSPTVAPSGAPGALVLPAAMVQSSAFDGVSATSGSRVVFEAATADGDLLIDLADLTVPGVTTLATVPVGHETAAVALTADWVVWVETWYEGPGRTCGTGCNSYYGLPLHWQVVAVALATRTRTVLASGSNTRVAVGGEGPFVDPPVLAVAGDRVAYTLEAARPGAPFGNRIVVRSLIDGSTIRTLTTVGFVPWVGLAGTAVAYRETVVGVLGGYVGPSFDTGLWLTTGDRQAPRRVASHTVAAGLSTTQIGWARRDAADDSVWIVPLAALGQAVHVGAPIMPGFTPQAGLVETLALGQGVAAWIVAGTDAAGDVDALALWTAGHPAARVLGGFSEPDFVSIGDGWLVWHEYLALPGQPSVHGIRLSDLAAMW